MHLKNYRRDLSSFAITATARTLRAGAGDELDVLDAVLRDDLCVGPGGVTGGGGFGGKYVVGLASYVGSAKVYIERVVVRG